MTEGQIVVGAAIANILATALIVLGAMVRIGYKLGALEVKVEAVWKWFLERSRNPALRRTD